VSQTGVECPTDVRYAVYGVMDLQPQVPALRTRFEPLFRRPIPRLARKGKFPAGEPGVERLLPAGD